MKILLLTGNTPYGKIVDILSRYHDEIRVHFNHPKTIGFFGDCDFLISYGYRYIIPESILQRFGSRAINLHISYLPWNRGADPNFWSWYDDTPKGVTIHVMDKGIDTGPILARKLITGIFDIEKETLRSTYYRLQSELLELFEKSWPDTREGKTTPQPQENGGTYHKKSELPRELLEKFGWDTKVMDIIHYEE